MIRKEYKRPALLGVAVGVILALALVFAFWGALTAYGTTDAPGICSNDKTFSCATNADCVPHGGGTCYLPTAGGVTLNHQVCIDDANPKDSLVCRANDVSIQLPITDLVISKPCAFLGDTANVSFVAKFYLTAQDRYDIGVWIAEDGGDALTGTCSVSDFPSSPSPVPWTNTDADTCGDIVSTNNPVYMSIQNIDIACVDANNDGLTDTNVCLSWRQPGAANDVCTSPLDAFPGAPSKCWCGPIPGLEIPIPPQLTLVKTVINDNGGTAVANDFQAKIDGVNVPWSVAQTLTIGAHTASETVVPGYAASVWGGDCAANGTITLARGDNKTCTITNNDIAPKLTLVKTVINNNGGNKGVADFPLFISGTPAINGTAYDQTANVLLTASETPQTGYTPSAWGGDCAADGTITLLPGDDKTCTISNDDIPMGCALSPGYWKGGAGVPKWDQTSDPIAQSAGFWTGTTFPQTSYTYLEVMQLPAHGDVTVQLGFKYIAARLNQVAFGVPSGVDTLLDTILNPATSSGYLWDNPVGTKPTDTDKAEGKDLLNQLNNYFMTVGEAGCPVSW